MWCLVVLCTDMVETFGRVGGGELGVFGDEGGRWEGWGARGGGGGREGLLGEVGAVQGYREDSKGRLAAGERQEL